EGRGLQLAVLVHRALEKRLADALRQAAVELAFDDHRIDHRADIVDGAVTQDPDRAGVAVDFELADMHAVGEGEVRRIVVGRFVESRLDFLVAVRGIGSARDVPEGNPAIRAGYAELAGLELDVALRRLEQMR